MLKMALLDCAITEKCYGVDGGRSICRLFPSFPVPTPGDLTAQESLSPYVRTFRTKPNTILTYF